MGKNITVLAGSPRKNGNTETLADAFISGAVHAGHSVKKTTLYNKKILPCTDCQYCCRSGGVCAIKDDMASVYEALLSTDILVLATPVYFYNFSAQLKCVLDRLHNPVRNSFTVKSCVLLSVCADEGMETFEPLVRTYKAICGYLGWADAGMVLIDSVEEKGAVINHPGLDEAKRLGSII